MHPAAVASTYACEVPSIASLSTHTGGVGARVTVAGQNFHAATSVACKLSVRVADVLVAFDPPSSNTSLTFTAQNGNGAAVNGPVVVTLTDPVGNSNSSNGNLVFGTIPSFDGLSTGSPVEGQAIRVAGSGSPSEGSTPR